MTLRVAVQMDPLDRINIAGDSTFALMLAAEARGHRLWHYAPEALSWQGGRLWAEAHPVTVQRVAGEHFRFDDPVLIDLGRDADVVLMRQDPPFDLGYITATHLLERIRGETLVVNDPASVRDAPEKVWVLDFARFMPPTLVTRSLARAREFLEEHGEIVVKPLHGFAGSSVFRIGRPRGTSASSSSTARSPARSTASPALARSAPTSRLAARRRGPGSPRASKRSATRSARSCARAASCSSAST
jgi:glutathione synthase